VATLTYVYSDQTAVLGPLATFAEPHAYDLCDAHSERLSAPRGWEILRLAPDPDALGPSSDDLLALADAVREAARPMPGDPGPALAHQAGGDIVRETGRDGGRDGGPDGGREVGRRGHLRVLRSPDA